MMVPAFSVANGVKRTARRMNSEGGIDRPPTTGSVLRQPFQAWSSRRRKSGTQPAPSSITPPRRAGKRSNTPSIASAQRKFCGAKQSEK